MPKDIISLEANTQGHDKAIGDLHGNRECFEAVLSTLGPHDRLFLVGDLVDRGADSPGIFKLIAQYSNQVFSIRGNHENICLNAIAALENIAINAPNIPDEKSANALALHERNGGQWLQDLFMEEVDSDKITLKIYEEKVIVDYAQDSQVKMIKEYMSDLPYIIHVSGDKAFNLVHADMPVNDQELQRRISMGEGLTKQEKYYSVWAREENESVPIQHGIRTPQSIASIVGHSIVDDPNVRAVREESNTFDIDVGSFDTNLSLILDITEGKTQFIKKFSVMLLSIDEDEELDSLFPRAASGPILIKQGDQIMLCQYNINDQEWEREKLSDEVIDEDLILKFPDNNGADIINSQELSSALRDEIIDFDPNISEALLQAHEDVQLHQDLWRRRTDFLKELKNCKGDVNAVLKKWSNDSIPYMAKDELIEYAANHRIEIQTRKETLTPHERHKKKHASQENERSEPAKGAPWRPK